jgi:hypothetical protein
MGGGDEAQKEGSRGEASVENEFNSLLLLISACWRLELPLASFDGRISVSKPFDI